MLKLQKFIVPVTIILIVLFVSAPARPGYSMSQIKSWVNKVRPGTFPELEAKKEAPAEAAKVRKPRQEALTDTERQILLSLNERKRQLDQRNLLLNQREEQLRALRDNIQRQVKELKRLQVKIEASMEAKKSQDAENLKRVVSLYNGMDPKKSASKFQKLDSKVAILILLGMNQRKAAAVLEELPPDVAKRITEQIVNKAPAQN